MEPLLVEAFRYNKWANLTLLEVCEGLSSKQLELTSPGTYGTISATLLHLVGAERRYLWRLRGQVGRFSQIRRFPGVARLKTQAALSGDGLIAVAPLIKASDTIEGKGRSGRFTVRKSVVLIQALHHGNDHRTHICTILGANGIPYRDMDVWSYGEAIGKLVELSPKA
jgi:uncharacterized damage-inducible protein DinB